MQKILYFSKNLTIYNTNYGNFIRYRIALNKPHQDQLMLFSSMGGGIYIKRILFNKNLLNKLPLYKIPLELSPSNFLLDYVPL